MVQTTPKATSSYTRSEQSSLRRSVRDDHTTMCSVCISYSRDGLEAYFHYVAIVSGLTKVQRHLVYYSLHRLAFGASLSSGSESPDIWGFFVEAVRRCVDGPTAALQV